MTRPHEVLVVDDSAVVRAIVRRTLEPEGHVIREAQDGSRALEACAASVPDAILLDVEMPVLDGFGTLAALAADPALAEVPVVLLSGRTDAEDVAEGLRRGATDYLRKPFQAPELIARVRSALRTGDLQRELRARNVELEEMASTDVLCGIGNRRWLEEEASRTLARHRRHGGGMSILLLDVDHFKAVNDHHGHAAGDAVLVAVARALADEIREEDLVARWGGEEFVVLAADTTPPGAATLGERLRQAVADLHVAVPDAEAPLSVTISIGWSSTSDREPPPPWERLVAEADEHLYEAKAAGRDAVRGDLATG